jgi:hypothetical protein
MSMGEVNGGRKVFLKAHLDTSFNNTHYLNLVFWYELSERDKNGDLQCHLAVILHAIPARKCRTQYSERSVATHRNKSAFFVAANSIQLRAKAIIFEVTMVTIINLSVSTLPHNRSR